MLSVTFKPDLLYAKYFTLINIYCRSYANQQEDQFNKGGLGTVVNSRNNVSYAYRNN